MVIFFLEKNYGCFTYTKSFVTWFCNKRGFSIFLHFILSVYRCTQIFSSGKLISVSRSCSCRMDVWIREMYSKKV